MINSRKLTDLDPTPRIVCLRHLALCHQNGIELIITSTWRDYESQDALYAIGRTVDLQRSPVTRARAGRSWHNFKCAWDVVPLISGKAVWDAADPIWTEVIKYGKEAGAEAGAEWHEFPDRPHFQVRPQVGGRPIELAEARELFAAHGSIFTGTA